MTKIPGDVVFTTCSFPNDLDTTSVGLTLTEHVNYETKMAIMDEMLEYRNADGIVTVYFDEGRPRIGMFIIFHIPIVLITSNFRFFVVYRPHRMHERPYTVL